MSSYKANKDPSANIDWDEVENKISIILRKFSNIDERYRDDLAQELRIHAYLYSDDYYDLQRKAIDFWRSLTRRVYPEVPFIDLELMSKPDTSELSNINYELAVKAIKKEFSREVYSSASDTYINDLALKILDVIIEDIDGSTRNEETVVAESTITLQKYRGGKINLSYLDLRFPGYNYKTIAKAFNRLKEVVVGLQEMGMI